MVFFQTRLRKILIWQKFSWTWESTLKKQVLCDLVSIYFDKPSTWHTIKTKTFVKLLQNFIDPETCSILISHISQVKYAQYLKSEKNFSTIFCVWYFKKKLISYYILVTDQISLLDCFYFLRYCTICVLQLFVSQVLKFEINLAFLIQPCSYMTKKSRQKFKYRKNEKRVWGEIKNIFHHF